jgi:DNA-binding MarR family transcriptional regulator
MINLSIIFSKQRLGVTTLPRRLNRNSSVGLLARPAPDPAQLVPLWNTGGRGYLGYRVVLTAKLFDRAILKLLREFSVLTLPQWRVVSQLGIVKEGTVRSLADGAAVDRAEVSRATRDLIHGKMLQRRENSDDFRSPMFTLTARGRREYVRVRTPISEFISHLVDGLPPKDIAAANQVLWQITRGCV